MIAVAMGHATRKQGSVNASLAGELSTVELGRINKHGGILMRVVFSVRSSGVQLLQSMRVVQTGNFNHRLGCRGMLKMGPWTLSTTT